MISISLFSVNNEKRFFGAKLLKQNVDLSFEVMCMADQSFLGRGIVIFLYKHFEEEGEQILSHKPCEVKNKSR